MDSKLSDGAYPMNIGDCTYLASMLCDRDYADLDNYIKSVFIANAVNASSHIEKIEDKIDIRKIALREAVFVGWNTPERIGIMSTPDGIIHLGYQLIRKRHPNISLNDFVEEVKKDYLRAFEQINIADQVLNYSLELQEDSEGAPGGSATGNGKSE